MARPVTKTVRYRLMPASDASPRAMPKVWSVSMGRLLTSAPVLQMETGGGADELFFDDRVAQRADSFDFHGDGLAGLEKTRRLARGADSVRRTGKNHRAGQERGG